MRFWIGVHLPLLALETFRPRWCEPGRHVVIEREQVLAMTLEAADAGVRFGMRRGGVAAICPDAKMHERDPALRVAVLEAQYRGAGPSGGARAAERPGPSRPRAGR